MSEGNKRNIQMALLSLGVLMVGFVLIRFLLFGRLHGMKQWPVILMHFCLVVIIISFIVKAKMTPISCSISYIIGFFLAYFFQTDGVDPGGGRTNNLWIIWTIIILVAVTVSGMMEYMMSRKNAK